MRLAATLIAGLFLAQAQDTAVLRKMADNKFATHPGLPACTTLAVQDGDPSKGPSVILAKARTGCNIPWHWHTATEHVMMVSGSARMEMMDANGKGTVVGPGGFAMMPGKHVHQFTCVSACTLFLHSSAAFDIHYVKKDGSEVPPESVLSKK